MNPPQDVTWIVEGNNSAGTTLSAAGLLRIANEETAESLTIRARSNHTNNIYGTATVRVIQSVTSVTVLPFSGN